MDFTALAVTTSKWSRKALSRAASSARLCTTVTLDTPRVSAASSMKRSFLRMASMSTTCMSGLRMARIIPGKPAPVPRSRRLPPCGKYRASYTVRESYTFLMRLSPLSLIPVRFITRFFSITSSLYFSRRAAMVASPWICSALSMSMPVICIPPYAA